MTVAAGCAPDADDTDDDEEMGAIASEARKSSRCDDSSAGLCVGSSNLLFSNLEKTIPGFVRYAKSRNLTVVSIQELTKAGDRADLLEKLNAAMPGASWAHTRNGRIFFRGDRVTLAEVTGAKAPDKVNLSAAIVTKTQTGEQLLFFGGGMRGDTGDAEGKTAEAAATWAKGLAKDNGDLPIVIGLDMNGCAKGGKTCTAPSKDKSADSMGTWARWAAMKKHFSSPIFTNTALGKGRTLDFLWASGVKHSGDLGQYEGGGSDHAWIWSRVVWR